MISVWSPKPSERLIIAFSAISTFDVQLPPGKLSNNSLQLAVLIRDKRDCVTEWELAPVQVRSDSVVLPDLIAHFGSTSTSQLYKNQLHRLLCLGNQNTVGQVVSAVSEVLNEKNAQNLQNALASEWMIEGELTCVSLSVDING
jgi:hypothetical protein